MSSKTRIAWLYLTLQALAFLTALFSYSRHEQKTHAVPLLIAKATGPLLHANLAVLILPLCDSVKWLLKKTYDIDAGTSSLIHKATAWSIAVFAAVHALAYWLVFLMLGDGEPLPARAFLLIGLRSGVGWSGQAMVLLIFAKLASNVFSNGTSRVLELFRCRAVFWTVILVLWAAHESFGLPVKGLELPQPTTSAFWLYWMVGGVVFIVEKVLNAIRPKCKTEITKVIQHPYSVIELQMRKGNMRPKAGQRVLLCCPLVSVSETRSFVLTSAPEDTYLSVHIRCTDNFTDELGKALGCTAHQKGHATIIESSTLLSMDVSHLEHEFSHTVHRILPQVLIQTPSEKILDQVFSYDAVILVGVGEGVLPFASILKSVWYRMNCPREASKLQKVYFLWVCYDFETYEWFRSILLAIEFQDVDTCIEIYPYLTAPLDKATATKNLINNAVNGSDIVTGLKAITRLGPPRWEDVLNDVGCIHGPMVQTGVFFRGPKEMGQDLKTACEKKVAFAWKGGRF